ncbi:hypothetical protein B7463_g9662, partial [Scytalidium lignicola]
MMSSGSNLEEISTFFYSAASDCLYDICTASIAPGSITASRALSPDLKRGNLAPAAVDDRGDTSETN